MNDVTLEMNNIINDIKMIAKQSKSYWINLDIDRYNIYDCKCSKCSKSPLSFVGGYEDWWMLELPKYCPNCGSEMETDIETNKKIDAFIDKWNNV